jgi:hypothetical protein
MCTAVLIGWDHPTPPLSRIWNRITRALLVSKDRRHLFVTPCLWYSRINIFREEKYTIRKDSYFKFCLSFMLLCNSSRFAYSHYFTILFFTFSRLFWAAPRSVFIRYLPSWPLAGSSSSCQPAGATPPAPPSPSPPAPPSPASPTWLWSGSLCPAHRWNSTRGVAARDGSCVYPTIFYWTTGLNREVEILFRTDGATDLLDMWALL